MHPHASQPENPTPPTIPLATFAPPVPVPTNRILNLGPKLKLAFVAALFVGSLFCCFVTTWYTASERAARLERHRIANELKGDFAQGLKNAFGEREGERIAAELNKNLAEGMMGDLQAFFDEKIGVDAVPGKKPAGIPDAWRVPKIPDNPSPKKLEVPPGFLTPDMFAMLGDGRVGIGKHGHAWFFPNGEKHSYFYVEIEIHNTSPNQILHYVPWQQSATVHDNFGNKYRAVEHRILASLNNLYVKPAVPGTRQYLGKRTRLDPMDTVSDLVFFERLTNNAEEVILRLPWDNLGITAGMEIKYKIPVKKE
jgi:hypothetical protein